MSAVVDVTDDTRAVMLNSMTAAYKNCGVPEAINRLEGCN